MAVNPNIALGVRGIELQNPLAQYGQVAAIQNAQNQNALAQFQLTSAQREQDSVNALNEAYKTAYNPQTGAIDLNALRRNLSTGGFGSKLPALEKSLGELQKQKLEAQKLEGEVKAQPTKLAAEQANLVDVKLKQSRQFLDTLDPIANPIEAGQQYLSWHEANHKDPILGPALTARGIDPANSRAGIMAAIQKGPQALANAINASKLGNEKFMELNKPQLSTKDVGGQIIDRTFEPLTGKLTELSRTTKTMTLAEERAAADSATRIKQEGQRIGLEGRRVAVMEENARRDKDPVFQQTMANAKATGEAIAKNDVAAKQALPKIISDAQLALNVVDQMVGKQEVRDANGKLIEAATKPHPGFQDAVGATWKPGARFVPGTNAASYQALQDQVEGTAFLSAFEALKGGGAISEKEGEKATAARLRMRLAQDEKEYIKAAREFQDVVRTGVQNAQRKAGGGAATGGTNVDALLEKYK
jgi:hypothetical protein